MRLSVENGCFAYKNSPRILNDVSFSVDSGELLAVLGPNGAGKTTLLKCIMGLLRWSSGRSSLDGQDIKTLSERKLFGSIAYVPQARAASPAYTALETVLLGRSSRIGVFASPKAADVELAEGVLKQLGIQGLRDKLCSKMSGGELQMVLIARALAAEPGVLILDEPESNLDFKNQLIVLDTVSALAAQGIACIFNTHYPEHALQRSDKALLLSRGGALYGSTSSVVTESNIEKAFGVKAKIGHVETGESIVRSVIPMRLSAGGDPADNGSPNSRALAAVTVISHDYSSAQKINSLLHEYGDIIIGRMGMPYRDRGVYIINASLDGEKQRIEELSQRLSIIPGVSIKTTFARENGNE